MITCSWPVQIVLQIPPSSPYPSFWRAMRAWQAGVCWSFSAHGAGRPPHFFPLGLYLASESFPTLPCKQPLPINWSWFLGWNPFAKPARKVCQTKLSYPTIPVSGKHPWNIVGPKSTDALKCRLCFSVYQVEAICINLVSHVPNPVCLPIGLGCKVCGLPRHAKAGLLVKSSDGKCQPRSGSPQ